MIPSTVDRDSSPSISMWMPLIAFSCLFEVADISRMTLKTCGVGTWPCSWSLCKCSMGVPIDKGLFRGFRIQGLFKRGASASTLTDSLKGSGKYVLFLLLFL